MSSSNIYFNRFKKAKPCWKQNGLISVPDGKALKYRQIYTPFAYISNSENGHKTVEIGGKMGVMTWIGLNAFPCMYF